MGLLLSLLAHCLSVAAQGSLVFGSDGVLKIAQFTDLHVGEGPDSDYLTGQVGGQSVCGGARGPLHRCQVGGLAWLETDVNFQACAAEHAPCYCLAPLGGRVAAAREAPAPAQPTLPHYLPDAHASHVDSQLLASL